MTDRKFRGACWVCGGLGSEEAVRPSQPVCRLHMLRGAAKTPAQGQPGVGPTCWPEHSGPRPSGVLGSLALGGPDPGRVWLLGGADSAGRQGCQGTLRCRKCPARPRSPFYSLLPGTQPRLAGSAGGERSGGFLSVVPATGPPERPWGRPARGGTQALVGACRLLPPPWVRVFQKAHTSRSQSEKGGNLFYLKGCVINKTKTK